MEHNQIGNKIRELRMSHNLTQADLGKIVGVSMQAVSKWERGGIPDIEILISIAKHFGVTMDELLGQVPDSSGQLADVLFTTMQQIPDQDKFEQACHYCWSIFKGISGMPCIQNFGYSTASSPDIENSRCRVGSNTGISYFVANQDSHMFAIAPEPAEGFNAMLGEAEPYVELFRFLSDPDCFQLFLFICARPQSLFSKRLASHATNIPEEKVKKVFASFEKRGWLIIENADMDGGTVTLYRAICKEHFIFFLLFAREMTINPRFWYLTSSSKRTTPLLRSTAEPTPEPAGPSWQPDEDQ